MHFNIDFLNHVAIRVKDITTSVNWYSGVLGLKKYQPEEWGDYPVFMMSGKSGVALFPAHTHDPHIPHSSRNVKIDHFAFNVSNEDFKKAQHYFTESGIEFKFQDHVYFHSIYLKDPDNHTVELTTLIADENGFYK